MNSLLNQLHDIEGIDPVTHWPLAVGWWIVIAFGIVLFCASCVFVGYLLAFKRSWKNDTLKKLAALEAALSDHTARETIILLSEYVRRIALKRYSRKECAGLTGEPWLQWLKNNDPKEFDWENKGTILVDIPYAPEGVRPSVNEIRDLIQAAKEWVR